MPFNNIPPPRRGDGNTLVVLEGEQIVITGDDQIGTGGERAGEHRIVVGIARDLSREPPRRHRCGQSPIVVQHLIGGQSRCEHGLGQLLLGQRGCQFIEQGPAGKKFHLFLGRQLDQAARRALPEEGGDQHIGVDHQPHAPTRLLRARRTACTSA